MAHGGRHGLMNDRFSADDLPTRQAGRSPWPIDLAHARPFRVGSIEVRPPTREVVSASRREVLEPRVMQVLVALASVRGEIHSRDDLIASCWDGRAVSDDAINRAISRLRAVGRAFDSFDVETIVKVGYRLVEKPTGAQPPPRPLLAGGLGRRALVAGGAAATALAGLGGYSLVAGGTGKPADPAIEHLMLRARNAARLGRPDDMARAAALYRQVVQRQPDNAAAWGRLATVYRFLWEYDSAEDAPAMAARVRSAAGRALEIDPANAEAAAALAMLVPIFGHWAQAEAAMRRVLDDYPPARIRLARLLRDTGRMGDALALVHKAVMDDPTVPRWWNFHAQLLWDHGRLEQAERAIDAGLKRWPRHILLWFTRFFFLTYTGRPRTAIAFAEARSSRPIGVPRQRFELAEAKARALATGAAADIDEAVGRTLAALPQGAVYAMDAVAFFSAIDRLDDAFGVTDIYYFGRGSAISELRLPQSGTFTAGNKRECGFLFSAPAAHLRADRRFARLVKDIGLENYWRRTSTTPDFRRTA
jgi:DNA-binding winged helix-turn-helix (wHTH) protein/tetratricopeptide (TPR) repeat protein